MTGRVLLVDDDRLVTQTLGPTMEKRLGVRMDVAANADEALALLERESFDVVMADFDMPGMDGIALLATVRQRWPRTRRVMVTAHGRREVRMRAVEEGGAQAFVTKPYSLKRIQKLLMELLKTQPPRTRAE